MSQGVPGTPPHPSLTSALARVASDPSAARYGPILGEPALRAALAVETNVLYGSTSSSTSSSSSVTAADIGITTGCNMAFLVLLLALCPPGSSVLLPAPAYFNYGMSMSLQNIRPVYIPSDPSAGFAPSLCAARAALEKGGNIRMVLLTHPSNPTGATLPPKRLEEWYDLAKEFGVALVLDETYRDFVEARPHTLFDDESWRDTLISIGSFSSESRDRPFFNFPQPLQPPNPIR